MDRISQVSVRQPDDVDAPTLVTVVEAPACHLCDDAKSTLAVLAQSYPMAIHEVSIDSVQGGALMNEHRAPCETINVP